MGLIRLLAAPIRSIVRFPLLQLAVVVAVILVLQGADDGSTLGRIFTALDKLVEWTVNWCAAVFNVKSFTRSWLTSGFMIAYVYLACLLILWVVALVIRAIVNFAGRHNLLWLRSSIARERGIAAYRAWEPFERIRPDHIPQAVWEETFAWPANQQPPYPGLAYRVIRAGVSYLIVILIVACLFQFLTPFPVLTWLRQLLAGIL